MYAILLANTWALSYNFIGTAPDWLSIYIPAVFTLICVARVIGWWKAIGKEPSTETAYRAMKRTNRLAIGIAFAFAFWSIELFPYGNPYAQAHVAFYMAITVIGVIFCLMHLRPAAFTVAVIVNAVFITFFGLSNIPSFVATAANVLLVSIAMLVILMVYYRDFTQMVAARAENLRLANVDALTDLPNRRHFFERLKKDYNAARAENSAIWVGVLDLDGFKPVNDLYGHRTGDQLLVLVARRLEQACAQSAYVARLGGDEFAIITPELTVREVQRFGDAISSMLREPYVVNGTSVEIAATVGFASGADTGLGNEHDLFERADYALYQGKRSGRGGVVCFSEEHKDEIQRAVLIEKALRSADLDEELSVVFQPIIDMQSGQTVGFEALARWSNADLGSVSPGVFIPIAERAGIVDRLTKVLLTKALQTASQWPGTTRLSFNLSARDISNASCALWLTKIIEASGFDPARIDFEITETAMMHDYDQALSTIEALKRLGCGISLDDFGTGYSSLSQLHSLPLTKIKIDRSFVANLHQNPASYKIVQSMILLSREMGLGCVVEGVESHEEAEALEKLGCALAQGYRYSRPLSAPASVEFVGDREAGANAPLRQAR